MKILVFPHDLGIGGSQIAAIELAAALQGRGHELILFGRPGALNTRIEELRLEFIEAPAARQRPTPAIVRALRNVVAERRVDVLHGYEWPPTLECMLAARRTPAVAVSTVMSMAVAPFIPKRLPLMVGTAEILAAEKEFGRSRAELQEPPVDLRQNNPQIDLGTDRYRQLWGLAPASCVVVMVTRLATELKLEGILSAIHAVGDLGRDIPVQLLIVGDGAARARVDSAAIEVNAALERRAVIVTGPMPDPRPAYAAADLVLGMGSSALRALAFAKPLIIQGEQGFWELLTPESLPVFLQQGFYGTGPGTASGTARLARLLRTLSADQHRRQALGAFGLETVTARFSLARAAERQEDFYLRAVGSPAQILLPDQAAAAGRFIAYHLVRRARRMFGTVALDDFNTRSAPSAPAAEHERRSGARQ